MAPPAARNCRPSARNASPPCQSMPERSSSSASSAASTGRSRSARPRIDAAAGKQLDQRLDDRPHPPDRQRQQPPVEQRHQERRVVVVVDDQPGAIAFGEQRQQRGHQIHPLAVHHDAEMQFQPVDAGPLVQLGGDVAIGLDHPDREVGGGVDRPAGGAQRRDFVEHDAEPVGAVLIVFQEERRCHGRTPR